MPKHKYAHIHTHARINKTRAYTRTHTHTCIHAQNSHRLRKKRPTGAAVERTRASPLAHRDDVFYAQGKDREVQARSHHRADQDVLEAPRTGLPGVSVVGHQEPDDQTLHNKTPHDVVHPNAQTQSHTGTHTYTNTHTQMHKHTHTHTHHHHHHHPICIRAHGRCPHRSPLFLCNTLGKPNNSNTITATPSKTHAPT